MNGAVSKKRWLMEIGIGFMLGRVWVFSINPFGLVEAAAVRRIISPCCRHFATNGKQIFLLTVIIPVLTI